MSDSFGVSGMRGDYTREIKKSPEYSGDFL
jgi:hypothetical protein